MRSTLAVGVGEKIETLTPIVCHKKLYSFDRNKKEQESEDEIELAIV